jgi:uncharacterized protein (TIGR00252 family)
MSTATGNAAESRAAAYLQMQGYKIIDRNWRTRYCEIDIVAEKNKTVWFVEVKFRTSSSQGAGYEYVTPKKLQQMRFAAEMWVQSHNWNGDYSLAVISVDQEIITFLDEL